MSKRNRKNRNSAHGRMRRALSIAMAAGVVGNVMALNVFADGFNIVTGNDTTNTPNVDAVANDDIIDNTAQAKLVIHKYDMTAALRGGVDVAALNRRDSNPLNSEYDRPDGAQDTVAETQLADYALANCEFSYLKVGDIATLSIPNGATKGGTMQVVYGIDAQLAGILGLSTETAAGENNAKYAAGDKYYYTSTQLSRRLAAVLDVQNTEFVNQAGANTPNGTPANTTQVNTTGKNAIEDYMRTKTPNGSVVTNASGVAETGNVPLGLYLIVETKTPENVRSTVNPFFVSLPMTSKDGDKWQAKTSGVYVTHVYPKNQTNDPTIDKLVHEESMESATTYKDTATASAGDIIQYRVVTQLPTITSKATHLTKYTFTDDLSAGLSYSDANGSAGSLNGIDNFKISIYNDEQDARTGTGTPLVTYSRGDAFGATVTNIAGGGHRAVIAMDAEHMAALNEINSNTSGAARTKYSDKWLVLSYNVKVMSTDNLILGDVGNDNKIKLTYQRTSITDPATGEPVDNTIEDRTIVYSYGINLKKLFEGADGNNHQADATRTKFVLYNKTDKFYLTANQDASGKYTITGKANARNGATEFSPASNGDLFINGIEADDYILTEVATDTGYVMLRDSIDIHIEGTKVTLLPNRATITGNPAPNANPAAQPVTPAAYTLNESAWAKIDNVDANMETMGEGTSATENARVVMSVLNSRGFRLPATGGNGVWLLTVTGIVGVAGAVYVLSRKKSVDAE